jgi:glutamine synthetase
MTGGLKILFTDLAGVIRGTEIPFDEREEFTVMFDASSVYGFEEIEDSDLELRLRRGDAKPLPWRSGWYGGIASIYHPDGRRYSKDPRLIAEKADEYAGSLGFTVKAGVELEFFIFRKIRASIQLNSQILVIDAPETTDGGGLIPPKKGYHLVEPVDEVSEIRSEIVAAYHELGFDVSKSHHEVATGGQVEITTRPYELSVIGDAATWLKYVVKAITREKGGTALLLPKPLPGDNGSGMHVHLSLWRDGRNIFHDEDNEYGLSQEAHYFIGGIIEHGRSLSAIVSPTINSYKRLIPGYEAPTMLAWGVSNRSVAIRIPRVKDGDAYRIEYRPPDPLANPYLAIPALLMAGIDGLRKKIDPGDCFCDNAYKYSIEQLKAKGYRQLPRSLSEALDELESDNEYLKPVFPGELIESYIEMKRKEILELQSIPSPAEYMFYSYW